MMNDRKDRHGPGSGFDVTILLSLLLLAGGCVIASPARCGKGASAVLAQWDSLNPDELAVQQSGRGIVVADRQRSLSGEDFVSVQFGIPDLTTCSCCETYTFEDGTRPQLIAVIVMRNVTTLANAQSTAADLWREFAEAELEFVKGIDNQSENYRRTEDAERVIGEHVYRGELLIIQTGASRFSVRLVLTRRGRESDLIPTDLR